MPALIQHQSVRNRDQRAGAIIILLAEMRSRGESTSVCPLLKIDKRRRIELLALRGMPSIIAETGAD